MVNGQSEVRTDQVFWLMDNSPFSVSCTHSRRYIATAVERLTPALPRRGDSAELLQHGQRIQT